MLETNYFSKVNDKWEDLSPTIKTNFAEKTKSGEINFARLLSLLLLMIVDATDDHESVSCFESVLVLFALYLEQEGVVRLRIREDAFDIISNSVSELMEMLTSPDYSGVLDDYNALIRRLS